MTGILTDRRTLLLAAASASTLAGGGAAGAGEPGRGGLKVVAVITALPAHAQDIRNALNSFATAARSEPGCLHYDLYEDKDRAGRFFTDETWTDEAALNAHLTSPAMKAAAPKLIPLLVAPLEINKLRPVNVT